MNVEKKVPSQTGKNGLGKAKDAISLVDYVLSPPKYVLSPAKDATSPPKHGRSPIKHATSPVKHGQSLVVALMIVVAGHLDAHKGYPYVGMDRRW